MRRLRFDLAVILLVLFTAREGESYALNGYRWPDGTQITMHLGLDFPPVAFQDGSASWNASAADALRIWNQYLASVQLAASAPTPNPAAHDGINSVFFSDSVYGETFGTEALAVTLYFSDSQAHVFSETDVIFNAGYQWDSYRGPLQHSGSAYTYDLHRVALHEFGHVLGLSHPDEQGQTVEAIMNSRTSDLDHLADDDIAGVKAIYVSSVGITSSPSPPSFRSGDPFSYEITANNQPTSYSATNLPPGLQLNATTGLISGRCTTSGTFVVQLTVVGNLGTATGKVSLVVTPLPLTSPSSIQLESGQSISYQITAGNNPTSFSAAGLPAGVVLNPSSGLISGTSTTAGNFNVQIKADSPSSEAAGNLTIIVNPPRITSSTTTQSGTLGGTFSYQITASNHPTSYSAVGLPAGLTLDPTTGLITGTIELSGSTTITISATGTGGTATSNVVISVQPLHNSTPPFASLSVTATHLVVADPGRHRIYSAGTSSITIVDADSWSVVSSVPLLNLVTNNLTLSVDASKLWIVDSSGKIGAIDLEALGQLPTLATQQHPYELVEGADGFFYVTDTQASGIFRIDPSTGNTSSHLPNQGSGMTSYEAISPDHRILYQGDSYPATLTRYDVSGSSGPTEIQTSISGDNDTYETPLVISPDGSSLAFSILQSSYGAQPVTVIAPTSDLDLAPIGLEDGGYSAATYSSDSSLLFVTDAGQSYIDVFDASDGSYLRTITLPDGYWASDNFSFSTIGNYLTVLTNKDVLEVYPTTLASAPSPPHSLLNVATRLSCGIGDDVLIGGFIITGTDPKKVVLRAIGPSLNLPNSLLDPNLELRGSDGSVIASNNNWNAHRNDILATTIPPSNEHESALVTTLAPGNYTAIVSGVNHTSGIALAELYDLQANSDSRIANISTRGKVETGDNVMIGSFIIGGDQPTDVIIRAIGPSLGIPDELADTTLELHDGNGTQIAFNDDWQSDQAQQIIDTTIPPNDPRESAIVATLPPGNYTAIVRGKNNTTGVALVEVYNLDAGN